MNSTRKSTTTASTRHASWIGGVLADIRLGQRRLIEFNRIPSRPTRIR